MLPVFPKQDIFKTIFHGALLIYIAILSGCGSSTALVEETQYVWPSPPDEARIRYLKSYQSDRDYPAGFGAIADIVGGRTTQYHLSRPFDVCSDGMGHVYVSDVEQGLFVFDDVKKEVRVLGEDLPIPLTSPRGIAWGNNKIFVGDHESGQVFAINPEGKLVMTYGKPKEFPNPVDVAYDKVNKRVIVVENTQHQVFVLSEDGKLLFTIGQRGEDDGEFNYPQSAVVTPGGNILVVDAFNYRIQEFDPNGIFLRKYGQQGNAFGMFARPKGISLDTHGNIYVVDASHQNFQVFTNDFELLLFVGRFSNADNWGFQNPVGIDVDQNNRIYVADQLNQRVQAFQLIKGE